MWVATIEVWPYGDHTQPAEIKKIAACNDGTSGSYEVGNYKVTDVTHVPTDQVRQSLRDAIEHDTALSVYGWPRGNDHTNLQKDQSHLQDLVAVCLDAMSKGEREVWHV